MPLGLGIALGLRLPALAGSALGALSKAPGFAGGDGTALPPGCAVALARARAAQSSAVLESGRRETSSCCPWALDTISLEISLLNTHTLAMNAAMT